MAKKNSGRSSIYDQILGQFGASSSLAPNRRNPKFGSKAMAAKRSEGLTPYWVTSTGAVGPLVPKRKGSTKDLLQKKRKKAKVARKNSHTWSEFGPSVPDRESFYSRVAGQFGASPSIPVNRRNPWSEDMPWLDKKAATPAARKPKKARKGARKSARSPRAQTPAMRRHQANAAKAMAIWRSGRTSTLKAAWALLKK